MLARNASDALVASVRTSAGMALSDLADLDGRVSLVLVRHHETGLCVRGPLSLVEPAIVWTTAGRETSSIGLQRELHGFNIALGFLAALS